MICGLLEKSDREPIKNQLLVFSTTHIYTTYWYEFGVVESDKFNNISNRTQFIYAGIFTSIYKTVDFTKFFKAIKNWAILLEIIIRMT